MWKKTTRKKITTPRREIATCQKTTQMWKTSDGSKSLKHNHSRGQKAMKKTFWEEKQMIPEMEIQIKKSPDAEQRQLVPSFGNIRPNWRERNQGFRCFHLQREREGKLEFLCFFPLETFFQIEERGNWGFCASVRRGISHILPALEISILNWDPSHINILMLVSSHWFYNLCILMLQSIYWHNSMVLPLILIIWPRCHLGEQ